MRRPAAGRKDRDKFVSGKTKQNAVKSMVLTDAEGRMLFCSPVRPGSCADITQARELGLGQLPGRRTIHGDPRGCRQPGHGSAGRRPGGDTAASQVKEERSCLVRGAARAAAHGALLTAHPCRARHRAPQELEGSDPPSWPTRAHE
ncbi:transposase family protein [Streptomyces liliiviolaceus]|uniref:transposase family protein n=1 Tax=Streptomyces liliiviolaceus TaxID=2823109 RepID=UPI001FFCC418|nr:transposase family protein [Streptomyces liliiviolaceus]